MAVYEVVETCWVSQPPLGPRKFIEGDVFEYAGTLSSSKFKKMTKAEVQAAVKQGLMAPPMEELAEGRRGQMTKGSSHTRVSLNKA